ncbi:MAG: hypothetical protein MUE98_02175 [Rhodobacteraceae bacterium]|nr:hypothetical protein [Paracoccaceae bacterium]
MVGAFDLAWPGDYGQRPVVADRHRPHGDVAHHAETCSRRIETVIDARR